MLPAPVHLNGRAIRAVILDYGEVLSFPPRRETVAGMAAVFDISAAKFLELYYAERYLYDRAEISAQQYWAAIARDAGRTLSTEQIASLRRTDVEMWSNVNPGMIRWVEQLRAHGVHAAVLSNMHADMAAVVRESGTWISGFDCSVLSAELGFAKPDPQIFQHCLTCLNVAAGEALFIDDKERNTRAGEELGIAGICANSPETIREQLQEAGWTGPLPG
jgi:putative hydrolase of the HAD superfamily